MNPRSDKGCFVFSSQPPTSQAYKSRWRSIMRSVCGEAARHSRYNGLTATLYLAWLRPVKRLCCQVEWGSPTSLFGQHFGFMHRWFLCAVHVEDGKLLLTRSIVKKKTDRVFAEARKCTFSKNKFDLTSVSEIILFFSVNSALFFRPKIWFLYLLLREYSCNATKISDPNAPTLRCIRVFSLRHCIFWCKGNLNYDLSWY